jgi:ATP-dependent DNA helicase RecQ
VRVPTKKQRVRAARAGRAAELAGMPVDEGLYEALRAVRKQLADAQNVPAYVVFSDATLAEMAARKPVTHAELLEVNGVGQTKLERYGDAFLAIVAGRAPDDPAPDTLL